MTDHNSSSQRALSRFYDQVTLVQKEDGFTLLLDQREAKTPLRHALVMPTQPLANAVLAEWDAQGEKIDFARMPFTRLMSSLQDKATTNRMCSCKTIMNFMHTDLLCYRVTQPASLVQRQDALWSGYLDWAACCVGVKLGTTTGIKALTPSDEAVETLRLLLEQRSDAEIFVLSSATDLLGSAILGLAFWAKHTTPEELFTASRLEEDFQVAQWGEDAQVTQKRAHLQAEFQELVEFWRLYNAS